MGKIYRKEIVLSLALILFTACDSDNITTTQEVEVSEAQCLLDAGGYVAIDVGGRMWLDRNLGASDPLSVGDYYQWGRAADGHENIDSATTETLATTLTPSHPDFIITPDLDADWVEPNVDEDGSLRSQSWSNPYDEVSNPNQVCPCGYVVPSTSDFMDVDALAGGKELLNLPNSGYRWSGDGEIFSDEGDWYWTSEASSGDNAQQINASLSGYETGEYVRAEGDTVRCIKPEQPL